MKHKLDTRGASKEGELAEYLYDKTCEFHKETFREATKKEDCAGYDRFHKDKIVDVKARKFKLPGPHTFWVELSAARQTIGTGWAYKDKHTSTLMVYEENNQIKNVIFGTFDNKDLIKLVKEKVDFTSNVFKGTLYKVYTRTWNGEHRGDTTVITYSDLESLPSFKSMKVPEGLWGKIAHFYNYGMR